MSGGGGTPGTGPAESFLLKVAQGDIKQTTNSGDISIRTYNKTGTNNIELKCGSIGPNSNLKLSAMEALMKNSPGGLASSVKLSEGTVSIDGDSSIKGKTLSGDISFEAKAGNINLKAPQKISIKSSTTNVEIEALVEMKLTAMLLNMKDVTTMEAKNGKVIPDPVGSYMCAIPVCPISGIPHTGKVFVGT